MLNVYSLISIFQSEHQNTLQVNITKNDDFNRDCESFQVECLRSLVYEVCWSNEENGS